MDITEARLSGGSAVDEAVNVLVKILFAVLCTKCFNDYTFLAIRNPMNI